MTGEWVQPVTLTGRHVELQPLTDAHLPQLREAARDPRLWAGQFSFPPSDDQAFQAYVDSTFAGRDAGSMCPFAVIRRSDGAVIGSTRYLNIVPADRRLEIGSTWYVVEAWGTAVNPECKLLLLSHAFETLQGNRVELRTDRLNERSQAAILKLGAIREGVLRRHMLVHGGRMRDTVVFAIIRPEWPRVKARLKARLASYA